MCFNRSSKSSFLKVFFVVVLILSLAFVFSCPRPLDPDDPPTPESPQPSTPEKPDPDPDPQPSKYVVSFSIEEGKGSLTATVNSDPLVNGQEVTGGSEIHFVATPEIGYKLDRWTKNGEVQSISDSNYSVTVNEALIITVKFLDTYQSIKFSDLGTFLAGAAVGEVHPISLTDMVFTDFDTHNPDSISKILKAHDTKKVAIRLPQTVAGLSAMNEAFNGCTNLVYLENIPDGVTSMRSCFAGCTALVSAPPLPDTVEVLNDCFNGCIALRTVGEIPAKANQIRGLFYNCTALVPPIVLNCAYVDGAFGDAFKNVPFRENENSIQVPASQLEAYRENATKMDVQADCFFSK